MFLVQLPQPTQKQGHSSLLYVGNTYMAITYLENTYMVDISPSGEYPHGQYLHGESLHWLLTTRGDPFITTRGYQWLNKLFQTKAPIWMNIGGIAVCLRGRYVRSIALKYNMQEMSFILVNFLCYSKIFAASWIWLLQPRNIYMTCMRLSQFLPTS